MNKKTALKIAVITLGVFAGVDFLRGLMHTFFIMYASENIAHMSQTADTLLLMSTFGIANFLSSFTYVLVLKKAKELSPYLLIIIPIAYALGIISMQVTGISAMQTSEWNGQYMMYGYLTISTLVGLNYFFSKGRGK